MGIGDTDGDYRNEIIIGTGEVDITVIEYVNGEFVEKGEAFSSDYLSMGMSVGDFDGDGKQEVVRVGYHGTVVVYGYNEGNYTIEDIWDVDEGSSSENQEKIMDNDNPNHATSGDIDSDGLPEIIISHGNYVLSNSFLVFGYRNGSYVLQWESGSLEGWGAHAVVGDADDDGLNELVTGSRSRNYVRVFSADTENTTFTSHLIIPNQSLDAFPVLRWREYHTIGIPIYNSGETYAGNITTSFYLDHWENDTLLSQSVIQQIPVGDFRSAYFTYAWPEPGNYTIQLRLSYQNREAMNNNWSIEESEQILINVSFNVKVTNDYDGDGVPDDEDAFPYDPTEWNDLDGDQVGDNSDQFPEDPMEWRDTDGDDIGDNVDLDDDGDGIPDQWENDYDLNQEDPDDAALDSDGDGYTDLDEYLENTNPMDAEDKPVAGKPEGTSSFTYVLVSVIIILVIVIGGFAYITSSPGISGNASRWPGNNRDPWNSKSNGPEFHGYQPPPPHQPPNHPPLPHQPSYPHQPPPPMYIPPPHQQVSMEGPDRSFTPDRQSVYAPPSFSNPVQSVPRSASKSQEETRHTSSAPPPQNPPDSDPHNVSPSGSISSSPDHHEVKPVSTNVPFPPPYGIIHEAPMDFFTKDLVNTEKLRDLLDRDLTFTFYEQYTIPLTMDPEKAYNVACEIFTNLDLYYVRMYKESSPFHAELWHYGETVQESSRNAFLLLVNGPDHHLDLKIASDNEIMGTRILKHLCQQLKEKFHKQGVELEKLQPGENTSEPQKDSLRLFSETS